MTMEFWVLAGFHVFIFFVLALDLGFFKRGAQEVGVKEAAIWTGVWVTLALIFALGIWQFWPWWDPEHPDAGPAKAGLFLVGYGIELSMSVDNLFVFLVIFRYFALPKHLQHRVLFWGILGAVIMRATFILAGVAILRMFEWLIIVLGVLLLYTAWRMVRSVEAEIDPGRNLLLRLAKRIFPIVDSYDTPHFWVKRDGRWHATPLPLIFLVVESTDVVFAMDSIPAIFGIFPTPRDVDSFIVYTSNIFAILGLRSLFFLLSRFLGMFRYLTLGLAGVLGFIGVKMIIHDWVEIPLGWSLGGIAGVLSVSVVASLLAGPKPILEHPPEAVRENDEPEKPVGDEKSTGEPFQPPAGV